MFPQTSRFLIYHVEYKGTRRARRFEKGSRIIREGNTPSPSTGLPFCLGCSNYRGCIATLARNAHVLEGKRVKRLPLLYARRAGLRAARRRAYVHFPRTRRRRARRGREKCVTRIPDHVGTAYLSLSPSLIIPRPSSPHTTRYHPTRASLGRATLFSHTSLRPPSTVMKKAIRVARSELVASGKKKFSRQAETMTAAQLVKRERVAD